MTRLSLFKRTDFRLALFGGFFLFLTYSTFFVFSRETVLFLGEEDSIFEYLTVAFFLCSSYIFLLCFFRSKSSTHAASSSLNVGMSPRS